MSHPNSIYTSASVWLSLSGALPCLCRPHEGMWWWPQSKTLSAQEENLVPSFCSSLFRLLAGPQSCFWENNVLRELNWSFIVLQTLPIQLRLGLSSRHTAYCWSLPHLSSFLGWEEGFLFSFRRPCLFTYMPSQPARAGCHISLAAFSRQQQGGSSAWMDAAGNSINSTGGFCRHLSQRA